MRFRPAPAALLLAAAAGAACTGSQPGAVGAASAHGVTGEEPIVGGPCEGCEAVFQGIPGAIPARARIAPADQPGEPMRITGTVMHEDGTPAPGTIVYAYHTDDGGIYPKDEAWRGQAAYRHGTLRAWVRADEQGHYRFDSIRPGGYPDSGIAEHVHMHVIEPGRCTYAITSIRFTDDPRLQGAEAKAARGTRGGPGLVTPFRDEDGVWVVERDVILGRDVSGHPAQG